MHQDAIHKRQPEHTPEKTDSLKLMNNATFTKQSGLQANKGNPEPHLYPQGNYIDLVPSQQCEK